MSSSSSSSAAFQLACGVQSYEWGKVGRASKAAQYGSAMPGFELDETKPYAEVRVDQPSALEASTRALTILLALVLCQLWMGTHPSCPSKNLSTGEDLQKLIAASPEQYLGANVVKKFGNDLPFLFKVLAIGKALSIQAHPDKELAQRLHKERPDVYKGRSFVRRRWSARQLVPSATH